MNPRTILRGRMYSAAVGRLLGGRYALERRIGEGGMADVLLARDQARGGTPVVVKRCKAHLVHQPDIATLFLREARLASLIHHPNVVELEATGEEDGQPYLVMEYLEGFTVREIFLRASREGGVPQDLAAVIVANAARGLHAAHTAVDEQGQPMGLMHRDVSPHNLFVTDSGVVKVLDFGIAKGVNEHTMTRAGHVKGKASYLAPEQLDPDAKIDARADLFSLGIVAWELLTGKRLFRRATEIDTIQAIRALDVKTPASVRNGVDAGLSAVVMRLLSRKPDARPRTADEVVRAFEDNLAQRHVRPDGAALASFVEHVREIMPTEVSRPSFLPEQPATAGGRAAQKRAVQAAWGGKAEEATKDVEPPVEGAWVSATGAPAPVDGSVIGTFAVAGATSSIRADLSGGYDALDPEDLVLEPSKSEPLPRFPSEAHPTLEAAMTAAAEAQPPAPTAPAQPAPPGVDAPRPADETTGPRTKTPLGTPAVAMPAPRAAPKLPPPPPTLVGRLVARVEVLLGPRPKPLVIVAVLAVALFSGITVSFLLASLVF